MKDNWLPIISAGIFLFVGGLIGFGISRSQMTTKTIVEKSPWRPFGEGQFIPVTITQEEPPTGGTTSPGGTSGTTSPGGTTSILTRRPVPLDIKRGSLKINPKGILTINFDRDMDKNSITIKTIKMSITGEDSANGKYNIENAESSNFEIKNITATSLEIHHKKVKGAYNLTIEGKDIDGIEIETVIPVTIE